MNYEVHKYLYCVSIQFVFSMTFSTAEPELFKVMEIYFPQV